MIHCLTPFGMLGSYGEARRFSEIRVGCGGSKESFWQGIANSAIFGKIGFGDLVFGSCNHRVGVGIRRVDGGGDIRWRRGNDWVCFWS